MSNEFLWTEKYRPHTIDQCILPKNLKDPFKKFVADQSIPNLILAGSSGVGKTTVAKAMLDEIDVDYIVINGSMNGNIDTLRSEIKNFASTSSLYGGRKYVILDEADYINPNSTQPALRNFMEEFSDNCGFILTCNFKNRIIQPLHSRCSVIDFVISNDQKAKIAAKMYQRAIEVLTKEGIPFVDKAVAEVVKKHFPDMRRVLNELQRYAAHGEIDQGILRNQNSGNFDSLIDSMKSKNFTEVRKWVGQNPDIDSAEVFRHLYDQCSNHVAKESIPQLVLTIADYQYKQAFVADPEINIAACLTEIMAQCEFK